MSLEQAKDILDRAIYNFETLASFARALGFVGARDDGFISESDMIHLGELLGNLIEAENKNVAEAWQAILREVAAT